MNVADAHVIASKIEKKLRTRFGETAFVSIHVEPLFKNGVSASRPS